MLQLWLFKPNPFSLDVKFNEEGTKIIASRFMIQAVNIIDGNMEKDMVRDLRRICDESHLNVSVFHPYFVFFDQVTRMNFAMLRRVVAVTLEQHDCHNRKHDFCRPIVVLLSFGITRIRF